MKILSRLSVIAMATGMTWLSVLEAQNLTISRSGLLTWQESGTQQVVVCTESLAGPWPPSGRIISRTQDGCSVAVEFAKSSEFFRLKPGAQFRDEFDGSHEPWHVTFFDPAESNKHTFTYTNGALRIQGASEVTDGRFALQPPAFAQTNVADFYASVDVVDWQDYDTGQIIGILARLTGANAYIGELWWSPQWFGRKMTVLNIFDGFAGHAVEVNLDSGKDYRIVFVGVTNRLACSLYELNNLQAPIARVSITNNNFQAGTVGLFCQREICPGPYEVTIDNFSVTGTKP